MATVLDFDRKRLYFSYNSSTGIANGNGSKGAKQSIILTENRYLQRYICLYFITGRSVVVFLCCVHLVIVLCYRVAVMCIAIASKQLIAQQVACTYIPFCLCKEEVVD